MKLVSECTCDKKVTTACVRKFGKNICCHMLAYLCINTEKKKQADISLLLFQDLNIKILEMSIQLVERHMQVYKSLCKFHCKILDLEQKFLSTMAETIKSTSRALQAHFKSSVGNEDEEVNNE